MLTTKVLPEIDRVALIRDAVRSPATSILLIQNGIGIEQEIAAAFPANPVYSAVAYIGVHRAAPGRIVHEGAGMLSFGCYGDRPPSFAARELATAFAAAGVKADAVDNLRYYRWKKLLWNATFNAVSVAAGGLKTNEMTDGGAVEKLCREVMLEVAACARLDGVIFPDQLLVDTMEYTRNFPPYKTSMLLDFEAGRPLEIDAIIGNAVRFAAAGGLAVPRLEMLETLLKSLTRHHPASPGK